MQLCNLTVPRAESLYRLLEERALAGGQGARALAVSIRSRRYGVLSISECTEKAAAPRFFLLYNFSCASANA